MHTYAVTWCMALSSWCRGWMYHSVSPSSPSAPSEPPPRPPSPSPPSPSPGASAAARPVRRLGSAAASGGCGIWNPSGASGSTLGRRAVALAARGRLRTSWMSISDRLVPRSRRAVSTTASWASRMLCW